jgi:hypothetical protein
VDTTGLPHDTEYHCSSNKQPLTLCQTRFGAQRHGSDLSIQFEQGALSIHCKYYRYALVPLLLPAVKHHLTAAKRQ